VGAADTPGGGSVVPVVDVGPLVELDADAGADPDAALTAGRAIDAACREVGFFSIVGHGVSPGLLERLDRHAREFFALPEDEKVQIAMPRAGLAWRGWFPLGGELTSGVPDLKEGLYFGAELPTDHPRVVAGTPLHGPNLFPERPAGLRDDVLSYMGEMTRVGQAVLRGVALALGLDRRWFVDHLTGDPTVLFRIFRYPPARGEVSQWGVAEHTDYGLLTLLAQDDRGGLQVKGPGGWVDVAPLPGALVCNIGDMLERLTGGRYRSTPHRVRNVSGGDRLSFPFFLDPAWDATVERLPIVDRPADDVDDADDLDRKAAERWDHASVHGFTGTYGDYLMGKVAKVFPQLAGDGRPG
jgi:isopenicillin N synthase-like dioxygenase